MPGRSTNPVLVLVEPGLPGLFDPEVDPGTFLHENWVRWPAQSDRQPDNRLLTLATGFPWEGESGDFQFESTGGILWQSKAYSRLQDRGHFKARPHVWPNNWLTPLANASGGVRLHSLMLALDGKSDRVRTASLAGPWPSGKVMVFEARQGSEIAQLMRQTKGRVLVVEYPPRPGENWSRIWLRGHQWPDGIPIQRDLGTPGLIDAGSLGSLLLAPERFQWIDPPRSWAGANRWMAFVQTVRLPLMACLGLLGMFVVAYGTYVVSQERTSALLVGILRVLSIAPAAIVLGGDIARYAGLGGVAVGGVAVWMAVAAAALAGIAGTVNMLLSRAGWRPDMVGYGIVGAVTLLICEPRFSLFSETFGKQPFGVSAFPLGALLASFAIVLGSLRAGRKSNRIGVFVTATVLIWVAILLPVWWKGDAFWVGIGIWLVPVTCWLRDRRLLFAAGLVSGLLCAPKVLQHGYAYLPYGLLGNLRQWRSVNTYDWLRVLISPEVLGGLLLLIFVAIFGAGFFSYRIRNAFREQSSSRIMAGSAGMLAGLSLFAPPLLEAAVVMCIGLVVVLYESLLRPADPIGDD